MDMLDVRMHHAILANEERSENLRRERAMRRQLRQVQPPSEPRSVGRRRWSLVEFFPVLKGLGGNE
jgi:hypothetical protein